MSPVLPKIINFKTLFKMQFNSPNLLFYLHFSLVHTSFHVRLLWWFFYIAFDKIVYIFHNYLYIFSKCVFYIFLCCTVERKYLRNLLLRLCIFENFNGYVFCALWSIINKKCSFFHFGVLFDLPTLSVSNKSLKK